MASVWSIPIWLSEALLSFQDRRKLLQVLGLLPIVHSKKFGARFYIDDLLADAFIGIVVDDRFPVTKSIDMGLFWLKAEEAFIV